MSDMADKLSYFQAITGLEDVDLCTEILSAHNWNLEQAISTFFTSTNSDNHNHHPTTTERLSFHQSEPRGIVNVAWKVINLPVSLLSGTLGLVSGAIGLGLWAAGGALSYSLTLIGSSTNNFNFNSNFFGRNNNNNNNNNNNGVGGEYSNNNNNNGVGAAAWEARRFVEVFGREYGGGRGPRFVGEGFAEALERSRREFRLLFVYLHSPDHPDTDGFCEGSLCSEVVSGFVNVNFVAWGGSVRESEGFKMSNSLKASRFPFCAVVMAATNQRIALLQQIEGPKSAGEMLTVLQRVLEESSPVLVTARLDAEERRNNIRLREEQDAAYQAALEADQAREREKKEEQERLAMEAAEAEKKRKEEEMARERAALEAAEREAALVKLREEKALSLGPEPEKGPDISQVLVRLPNGERKGRRFHSTATVQSLYDFLDSSGCLEIGRYTLATNFPRVLYGPEKLSSTLKEAGLHPQVSLFVELNS